MTERAQPALDLDAIVFDVFGTLVDYHGTIVAAGRLLSERTGLQVDWPAFAHAWRSLYHPYMQRVMREELPWANLDTLHRLALEEIAPRFGLAELPERERGWLNRVWHALDPWPDVPPALHRLRVHYLIAPLSNGNTRMLVDIARHGDLPWDLILSAEMCRAYKPDPRPYQMAIELLDVEPARLLLVAAHIFDLRAARAEGLRTAYIPRPHEDGPYAPGDPALDGIDLVVRDLADLADQLGA